MASLVRSPPESTLYFFINIVTRKHKTTQDVPSWYALAFCYLIHSLENGELPDPTWQLHLRKITDFDIVPDGTPALKIISPMMALIMVDLPSVSTHKQTFSPSLMVIDASLKTTWSSYDLDETIYRHRIIPWSHRRGNAASNAELSTSSTSMISSFPTSFPPSWPGWSWNRYP